MYYISGLHSLLRSLLLYKVSIPSHAHMPPRLLFAPVPDALHTNPLLQPPSSICSSSSSPSPPPHLSPFREDRHSSSSLLLYSTSPSLRSITISLPNALVCPPRPPLSSHAPYRFEDGKRIKKHRHTGTILLRVCNYRPPPIYHNSQHFIEYSKASSSDFSQVSLFDVYRVQQRGLGRGRVPARILLIPAPGVSFVRYPVH